MIIFCGHLYVPIGRYWVNVEKGVSSGTLNVWTLSLRLTLAGNGPVFSSQTSHHANPDCTVWHTWRFEAWSLYRSLFFFFYWSLREPRKSFRNGIELLLIALQGILCPMNYILFSHIHKISVLSFVILNLFIIEIWNFGVWEYPKLLFLECDDMLPSWVQLITDVTIWQLKRKFVFSFLWCADLNPDSAIFHHVTALRILSPVRLVYLLRYSLVFGGGGCLVRFSAGATCLTN